MSCASEYSRLVGLEKDLRSNGYDYDRVLSTFYISYIIFQTSSKMACTWIYPGCWIPSLSLDFGFCSNCTALCITFIVHPASVYYSASLKLACFRELSTTFLDGTADAS
ncbi:hypothetical protein K432DRAFT_377601 [Lepidopterella palustris CBS 459.81]|uniref:Uncharacterized protein n=1 Tax=Lepidopterella palustris CBS 459.81 TaxID=1314670 RepID=A0A8E2EKI0_9PEZI|nr:hypothetical protein K432DRAFT_377601 [Lepidopterella palustris CBS 459.81]